PRDSRILNVTAHLQPGFICHAQTGDGHFIILHFTIWSLAIERKPAHSTETEPSKGAAENSCLRHGERQELTSHSYHRIGENLFPGVGPIPISIVVNPCIKEAIRRNDHSRGGQYVSYQRRRKEDTIFIINASKVIPGRGRIGLSVRFKIDVRAHV